MKSTPQLEAPRRAPGGIAVALPRVSLVTPSKNQGGFLEQAMRSVLDQGYPDLEYQIVDGGSTDESPDIIERYAGRLAGWIREADQGQGDALRKGFARATGEVMGWLNADDVLFPGALRIVGQVFRDHPQVEWLTGGAIHLSADGRLFGIHASRRYYSRWMQLLNQATPPQQCTFWRRSLWERAQGGQIADGWYPDCQLWLRFYEHAPLYVADTIFGAWRLHEGSYSTAHLRALRQHIRAAQAPLLEAACRRRPWLRLCLPVMAMAWRPLARESVNRAAFSLFRKRTRLLTFNPARGGFHLPGAG